MNEEPDRRFNAQSSIQNNSALAVGNSWIVCKSKRFPGRNYYFNTVSGVAAWDLCPSEIETAKRRTKEIEDQPCSNLRECPEPKGPPSDLTVSKISSQYKGQINYNQNLNHTSPSAPFIAHQCDSYRVAHSSDIILQAPVFNPNVWTVQPHQQIKQSCTFNPGQIQTSMVNLSHHPPLVALQTIPIDPSRFQSAISPTKTTRSALAGLKKARPRKAVRLGMRGSQNLNGINESQLDLRQKLSAKRQQNLETNEEWEESETSPEVKLPNKNWYRENNFDDKMKLYLVSLKSQAPMGTYSDCWYIVVDASVMLTNLFFLHKLVKQDDECRLMVPRKVMTEIRAAARAGTKRILKRAINAIKVVENLMSNGKCFIGEEPSVNASGIYIIDCCLDLHKQRYYVVLITNDDEILQHKDSASISILNVEEIKKNIAVITEKPKVEEAPLEHLIKIIIPNNVATSNCETVRTAEHKECQANVSPSGCEELYQSDNVLYEENHESKTPCLKKVTVDVEVQTDFISNNPLTIPGEISPIEHTGRDVQTYSKGEKVSLKSVTNNTGNLNHLQKQNEIKLKRNFSHVSSENSATSGKTSLRWRKRRVKCRSEPDDTKDVETVNEEAPTNQNEQPSNTNFGSEFARNAYDHIQNTLTCVNEYNEVVETDDDSSCIYRPTHHASLTIEETSTSGVLSNAATASNVDSESVCSNFTISAPLQKEDKQNCDKTVDTHVMFEVTGPIMEEHLKNNRDEWVSRFVQIMEEVLTQILQREPKFKHSDMPPPWTIHEAAECIKIKYHNDNDVCDACDKLSTVLFDISDNRGKIQINLLKPKQFMELYSYGVYLVDTLQTHTNCEDLQAAAESLANLFRDIEEPFSDTARNKLLDTFNDNANESINVTLPCSPCNSSLRDRSPVLSCKSAKSKTSPLSKKHNKSITPVEKYNLRSSKTAQEKTNTETKVTFVRNIETSFFDSLNLKKKMSDSNGNPTVLNNETETCLEKIPKENRVAEINIEQSATVEDRTNKVEEIKTSLVQSSVKEIENDNPKIIRNFSLCSEYEKKLKSYEEKCDMDELDFSEDEEDNFSDEYYSKDEFLTKSVFEDKILNNYRTLASNQDVNEKDNESFRFILQTLSTEIKETFLRIHSFCDSSMQDLSKGIINEVQKSEIRCKAEQARSYIKNLCNSLHSSCSNERNNTEIGLASLLQSIGNCNIILSEKNLNEYRNLIKRSVENANILYESMDLILNAIEE